MSGGRDSSARRCVSSFTRVKSSGWISPRPSGKQPTRSAFKGCFTLIGSPPPSIIFNPSVFFCYKKTPHIFNRLVLVLSNHLPSLFFFFLLTTAFCRLFSRWMCVFENSPTQTCISFFMIIIIHYLKATFPTTKFNLHLCFFFLLSSASVLAASSPPGRFLKRE